MRTTTPSTVFDGTEDVYVETFLFTNNNVVMQVKEREDRATCVLAYMSGEVQNACRSRFIRVCSLVETDLNQKFLCTWLDNLHAKTADMDEQIRIAMNVCQNKDNFLNSSTALDEMFIAPGFYDIVKYGMPRKVGIDYSRFFLFSFFKRSGCSQQLKEAIIEYFYNCGSLFSSLSFEQSRPA